LNKTAIVVGAAGAVGEACALALRDKGWRVIGTLRRDREGAAARLGAAGVELTTLDVRDTDALGKLATHAEALVFTPHLQLLMPALPGVIAKRLIAFSSNNVAIVPDAPSYRDLALAEAQLRAARPDACIIRPTLIYGDPRLATITQLMRRARRWPILPMPGSGKALAQPVFHEDLGVLAAGLAEAPSSGGVFAAGGPEVMAMAELLTAVCEAAGAAPRIVPVPAWTLRAASHLRIPLPLSLEQIARADLDRKALSQDPIPPGFEPLTPLALGLSRLARALGA
jgi:nucleoside-diphosphate-sugar epimerase